LLTQARTIAVTNGIQNFRIRLKVLMSSFSSSKVVLPTTKEAFDPPHPQQLRDTTGLAFQMSKTSGGLTDS
jgi:hypothetical protein